MERKEAIEIVRKLYNESLFLKKDKEAMITLIPELAESEDEKIRKELLLDIPKVFSHDKAFRYIAYLEKQGEHTSNFKVGDTVKRSNSNVTYKVTNIDDFGFQLDGGHWFKLDRKSEFELVEHKSAFWSEEDEERYLSCLKRLGTGNIEHPETINTVWLKSLKDKMQPYQEWSEEDKMQLDAAIHLVSSTGHNATADWLRALKNRVPPQSAWKPSDEQFKLLKHIMENVPLSYRDKSEVGELYLDLKKLTYGR